MEFKNETTGLVFLITDKEHQKQLSKNDNYTLITEKSEEETTTDVVDITELDWNDLRSLAHEKGINPHGKKRVDIEQELGDLDD